MSIPVVMVFRPIRSRRAAAWVAALEAIVVAAILLGRAIS
jgi:hypothetical protein